jgi:hypothetical protein
MSPALGQKFRQIWSSSSPAMKSPSEFSRKGIGHTSPGYCHDPLNALPKKAIFETYFEIKSNGTAKKYAFYLLYGLLWPIKDNFQNPVIELFFDYL